MILNTENGFRSMAKPFHGLIIQVSAVDAHLRRKLIRINGEPVVLCRDLDPSRLVVLDRLITAPMTKLELECLCPEGLPKQLMTQADAENRNPGVHKRSNFSNNSGQGTGIAGTITQKDPCRLIL